MEPTSLTCPKCGASWKLIKAGKGPITCPMCKAALDGARATPPASEATAAEPPPTPVAAAPAVPAPLPALSPLPPFDVRDTDDPGLRADFDDHPEPQRRRGMAPLLKVALIFLALMILLPLAVFILLAVVCAIMFAAG